MTDDRCELCDDPIGMDDRRSPFENGWVHEYCARNRAELLSGPDDGGLLVWDDPDGGEGGSEKR